VGEVGKVVGMEGFWARDHFAEQVPGCGRYCTLLKAYHPVLAAGARCPGGVALQVLETVLKWWCRVLVTPRRTSAPHSDLSSTGRIPHRAGFFKLGLSGGKQKMKYCILGLLNREGQTMILLRVIG